MKKILSAVLCAATLVASAILPASAETILQGRVGKNVLSITKVRAFEGTPTGYESSLSTFDGRNVRTFARTGSEETSVAFNLYSWDIIYDVNNNMIPFDTANYVLIDYYYKSGDAEPALNGAVMKWTQGAMVPSNDLADKTSISWSPVASRNTIVANKWDTIVIPLCENNAYAAVQKQFSKKECYLHQYKMMPITQDMGLNDILYVSDVTFQSWDPDNAQALAQRTLRFHTDADVSDRNVFSSLTAKDLETVTLPAFDNAKLPENSAFSAWKDVTTEIEYRAGDTYVLRNGADVDFVPVFDLKFDFSALTSAYIAGYPDGTFRPQNNVTRAEACKILASLINPDNAVLGTVSFSDIPSDAWYANYVATLEKYGALNLWKDTFEADKKITRAELVTIVYNITDHARKNAKFVHISDVGAEDSYYDAVMYSISEGIVAGYEDGTFKPNNSITRAETVTVVNRFIGRIPNDGSVSAFSDIEGHWGKGQIVAAASEKATGAWTLKEGDARYELSGTSAEGYLTSLHTQAKKLSPDAIRAGIDTVSEQMKKDILGTKNTEEYYADKMTGPKWYVSELHGNDENDGKSPATAVKTISGLNNKIRFPKSGTSILFERGGVYRGNLRPGAGMIIGSYGEGAKPIIMGSARDYASPDLWEETDVKNVYHCKIKLNNVGVIALDHDIRADGNYDALYGINRILTVNVSTYADLKNDREFFSCADDLYFYSENGNPGSRFKSIEIGTRTNIISGSAQNVIIDNLSLKYDGAHGIGYGSTWNLTVTNCTFSWIGGSLLGNYGQTTTQYGNAIEIFGSCNGYYVSNNWMYQIYDTAVTHQYSSSETMTMNDIRYTGNLMEYVHWGIEFYNSGNSDKCTMTNYTAHYNVLRNGGYGWGSIVTDRQKAARLYCGSVSKGKNENLLCEYNVIDRCAGYLFDTPSNTPEVYRNNIYVQHEGGFGRFRGKGVTIGMKSIENVYSALKDDGMIFIVERN